MLNNILRAFAPLLLSATLMLAWVILIATLVILWLVGKFRDGRVTTGVVTLLALVILPLSSWLLGRSFFRAGIFAGVEGGGLAAISENIGSALENSRKPVGPVEPEEPSGSASVEPLSSPASDVPTDPNTRKPEDYTDEELLKLAEENFYELFSYDIARKTNGLLPTKNFDERINVKISDSSGQIWERSYRQVLGYTTLEEAAAAMEEKWYSKFSHKYPKKDFLSEATGGNGYALFSGAVYAAEPEIGGPSSPFVVDGITKREGDEVVFNGHWDYVNGVPGEIEFSFVFEDGRWKYGYYGHPD